ncbi:MAG: shikimate dehydrogenase [Candidatus Dormibacter sp.]
MTEGQRRVVLIGASVRQSLSTALQNAGFQAAGLDCRYEPIDLSPDQLASFVTSMRGDPTILGANVTIPHKEAIMPLLDQVDPSARTIGAVNTISRDGARLVGSNTDAAGFAAALAELGYDPAGRTAVVIGAGGAARAVVSVLQPKADRLWVVNRNLARAERLCADLEVARGGAVPFTDLDRIVGTAELIVNATPADITGPASPSRLYFDLRSRQSQTGRLMLLHQGLIAFEIWTGDPPPAAAMRATLARAAEGATA